MGIGGSTNRRTQYGHQPHASYSYANSIRSPDPYTVPSEHTPRIVVHGTPYMDHQTDRYVVKQKPSSMRAQQQVYNQPKPTASRTSFQCERGTGMLTQQTPTPPSQQPSRNPVESCNCKTCQEKEQALAAAYVAASSAANTTYVAQNQCAPSTSVATRTAIPASTCTGCTKTAQQSIQSNTMGYSSQQRVGMDRVATSVTTCGAPNCKGHAVEQSCEQPIPNSINRRSTAFEGSPMGRMQQTSMQRQSITQTSCHDGISPSGAVPSDFVSEFHHECLEAHNRCRARHQNCPPLSLSSELSKYAQQWAKHLASTGRLEHRQVHTYGENLYTSRGMAVNGETVVQNWYNEIRYYDFSNPNYKPGTGHFTQVVWRDSRQLGVGIATRGDTTYVVCNYNPPGNIIGSFDGMVPKLK